MSHCTKNPKRFLIFSWRGPHFYTATWVRRMAFQMFEVVLTCKHCGACCEVIRSHGQMMEEGIPVKRDGPTYGYDPRDYLPIDHKEAR